MTPSLQKERPSAPPPPPPHTQSLMAVMVPDSHRAEGPFLYGLFPSTSVNVQFFRHLCSSAEAKVFGLSHKGVLSLHQWKSCFQKPSWPLRSDLGPPHRRVICCFPPSGQEHWACLQRSAAAKRPGVQKPPWDMAKCHVMSDIWQHIIMTYDLSVFHVGKTEKSKYSEHFLSWSDATLFLQ